MAAAAARAYVPTPDDDPSPRGAMAFLEHLDELRKRIIRSLIAIAVGSAVAFLFINRIFTFLMEPTRRVLPAGSTLIYTDPSAVFALEMQLAVIAGTILASPYVMFQVWRFIAPGLYADEKRFAIPFVALSSVGMVAGAAFNHYVLFASAMTFFASFNQPELRFLPSVDSVFSLYTKMLIGMALTFQLPTIVFFLARMRLVTARWLAKNIKYAILVIFIVAAVLTPSADPFNQTLFAAPMIALYLLSILIAWAASPRVRH
jgi:sec-independent protein translocase protein TatC